MNDLISRQAAIDALYDWSEHSMTDAEAWHIRQVIGDIKSMPSAQPERMKGKWERRLVDSGFNADWRCSKCGWKTALEEHGYNYCPNCGADMRGEQDDESRSNSNAQTDTRARGMGATDKSSGI